MPSHHRRSVSSTTRGNTGTRSNGNNRRLNAKKHLKWMGGAVEKANGTFELYNNVFGEDSPLEAITSKKRKPSPGEPDVLKSEAGAGKKDDSSSAPAPHDYRGRLQTESALQAAGFALGPWDEPGPVALGHDQGRNSMLPAEMMEAVVNAIKTAYNPVPVNVVTWDAALHPETVNCGGQLERGTAYNVVLGVSYRFVVFSGQGLIKWRAGDVGCTGNVSFGGDFISFGDPRYGNP